MDLDGLGSLSEQQVGELEELVRQHASDAAEEAVASGRSLQYLLEHGWSVQDVRSHLDASAFVVTLDVLVGFGPHATWSHQGRLVNVVLDADRRPRTDQRGRVLISAGRFDGDHAATAVVHLEQRWVRPGELSLPEENGSVKE
ncbi:hypothetical protein [Kineococcus indalonis]|uniref:hypothetical protein n=1 Tax=Kineococcus indalonis TaxID=2696566 RepID=UPI00141357BE|nr:hypothetical protein [Kineococcus indalonis]NAZ84764.1 hypothetical protein [Kineococcus indalonis]